METISKNSTFRENALSLLLKYSLSTARLSQFLFSFGEKQDDNENIVQLASKLSRTKKAANNLALKREKVYCMLVFSEVLRFLRSL